MSLVLAVCDSGQCVALSDGRAFSLTGGEMRFARDDLSKIIKISPRVLAGATGRGGEMFLEQIGEWAASWTQTGAVSGRFFLDAGRFCDAWLREWPLADAAIILAGWDDRLERMRVATSGPHCASLRMFEASPYGRHLPIFIGRGCTDGLELLPPETFAVPDPLPVLREMMARVMAKDSRVGGLVSEYLCQGPADVLQQTDSYRCWPAFDPVEFSARFQANRPCEPHVYNVQLLARLGNYALEHDVSMEQALNDACERAPRESHEKQRIQLTPTPRVLISGV